MGGNPWIADATNATVRGLKFSASQFALQFQVPNGSASVTRQFQSSGNLLNWTNTTPATLAILQNMGANSLYQALCPIQPEM